MRINYRTFVYGFNPKGIIRGESIFPKYSVSDRELLDSGRRIESESNGFFPHIDDTISREVVESGMEYRLLSGYLDGPTYTSGRNEYCSPIIDLAKMFALYIGDNDLYKCFLRVEKYHRETYESAFNMSEIAHSMYSMEHSVIEREKEIHDNMLKIQSDNNLSQKERKKKIVMKEKELREIKVQAEKRKKAYANKYVRLMRKSASQHKGYYNFEKLTKACDILREISTKLDFVLVEQENFSIEYLGERYYKSALDKPQIIDNARAAALFEELQQQFYPNKNISGKTL